MNEDIKKATEVLKKGGIILYPTDTIWGLGCDATNNEAVTKIYKIKKRVEEKSMLILLNNTALVASYASDVPEVAYNMFELSEKPLTLILSGAKNLAENLIAPDGSIGIRITNEIFSKTLLQKFRKPIVSTSANITGEKSPRNFAEISQKIIDAVDYIVTYGQNDNTKKQASSSIKINSNNEVKIIRK